MVLSEAQTRTDCTETGDTVLQNDPLLLLAVKHHWFNMYPVLASG